MCSIESGKFTFDFYMRRVSLHNNKFSKQTKKSLFEICDVRLNYGTEAVSVRLSDTQFSSDLQAADVRYHADC